MTQGKIRTTTQPTPLVPQVGWLAQVRNRRARIVSVEPSGRSDGRDGRTHLVRVEYSDFDGVPDETLLWEREHGASLIPPTALPRVSETDPMPAREFDALLRASRWSALTPYLSPDGKGKNPGPAIAAPFFGAVQVEDFQLVPLLEALRMPRVSLLLADDVGLGKTIEAGLILAELLLRRRIRRVLILCFSDKDRSRIDEIVGPYAAAAKSAADSTAEPMPDGPRAQQLDLRQNGGTA
jgi:hypothetical protein